MPALQRGRRSKLNLNSQRWELRPGIDLYVRVDARGVTRV